MKQEKQICNDAKRLGACSLLTGKETMTELMTLIFTPQGTEFCTKFNFPDLAVFRQNKGAKAEKNGIYVDATANLHNAEQVLLVGNTEATLTYDDPTKSHHVILMHGAKATINAFGYSVVFVTNNGGELTTHAHDYAKIV